jgi:inorganic phosphate transporter, PiT family
MALFLIFLSSGLFLGWSLGGNDAANIFGSAVGSKMLSFKRSAFIAGIFVILGAVFQGRGGAETLNSLGAVDAMAGGFAVSLCAAFTVFLMTKRSLPVSTSQAVVGAIIGWTAFSGNEIDYTVLRKIVTTWISGPILGLIFSALLYLFTKALLRRAKIHVIRLDYFIRIGLIAAGAFGAYSLGANNIANVMGVFVSGAPDVLVNFGLFTIDGVQLLFLIGAIAIAVGIFTYSERVMNMVGNGLLSLSPEAAIVVVLSHGLVLFLFSSITFSNMLQSIGFPALPLVPVSSTQVIIGSVLGIGIVKGTREIKLKTLAGIAAGWVVTPIIAGVITFFLLFFLQNVFDLKVTSGEKIQEVVKETPSLIDNNLREINLTLPGILIAAAIIIIVLIVVVFSQQRRRLKDENELLMRQNQVFSSQKVINEFEINAMQTEKTLLQNKLETKRKEFADAALNLSDQKQFLEQVLEKIEDASKKAGDPQIEQTLKEIELLLRQRMSFSNEKHDLYSQVDEVHQDFIKKISADFPQLTDYEKRLATFIRLSLSTKEIATLMNISPKSVEVARYRLKKTLGLKKDDNLVSYINNY